MQISQRRLGYRIRYQDTTVSGLLKQKQEIKKFIDMHGCICLENIDFEPQQIVQFTKGMFDQILQLPKQLAFNNQDTVYKSVTRVGNVLIDGTLKDSSKQAIYWHQDGDFWGERCKHLFNFLHTKQIPDKGGDTWIMDLVEAAKFLQEKRPQIYSKLNQLKGELDLDLIDEFHKFQNQNFNIPNITHHRLVNNFGRHGYDQVLFLSVHRLIQKDTAEISKQLHLDHLIKILTQQMGFYKHKWQKGDMLIWDNWQVLHRSSGDIEGRRLLFRTQGEKKYY